ncbi:MAG TPA: glycosyltransferase family 39 protein [Caulobacteraceae bacterium]|jgi:4-amino-4-deoxy-L-arabinose transferase-like glycosyltransferase
MTDGRGAEQLGGGAWRWALLLAGAITAVRVAAVFLTPLELYPDEAQYWLWSTQPAWGYASKPPMIAWLIAASTAIGGDGEAWVRLPAPLVHGAAAMVLFETGRRLYGGKAGLLACALWLLMPAVALSSLVIATDAPLLLFWSLALVAYVRLWRAPGRGAAALLGAALGLAFLSKQAALYFPLGLLLHAAIDAQARRAWRGWRWAAGLTAFLLVISPNLVWQAGHGFATVAHTAEVNAGAGEALSLRPLGPPEFLLSQIGVFGPFPFFVLITGAFLLWRSRKMGEEGRLLLCLAAPPLAMITAFSLFREVEANWASAAFPSAVVAVGAWLTPRSARRWRLGAVIMQGLASAALVAVAIAPQLADAAGGGNALKRLRGWGATAQTVAQVARANAPVTAVVVEDRSLFNELAYYGRGLFTAPGAPPLRIRGSKGRALNQAQLAAPLQAMEAGRVLAVVIPSPKEPSVLPSRFRRVQRLGETRVRLDPKRERPLAFYLGDGLVSSR